MKKILMVCLGNVCRSPIADGIHISKLPKTHFFVDSARTSGFHNGSSPQPRSIEIAQKYALNIENQKSRQYKDYDFEILDFIYVIDNSNHRNLLKYAKSEKQYQKVKLILDYPKSKKKEVPDPCSGGNNGFESVFKILNSACDYHSQQLIKAL